MPRLDIVFNPDESFFSQTVDAYRKAGYTPIPILPRDKIPGEFRGALETGSWTTMGAWNTYAHRKPEDAMYVRWKTWPDANIGVVLGGDHAGYQLVAVDFDTDIDAEIELLQSALPMSPMRKKGHRGYTAFYRAAKTVKTKRYPVPDPTDEQTTKQRMLLEILTGNAPRQTVMPPSLHPFGMMYDFLNADGIVPVSRLPILTEDHLADLEDNLGHLGWQGDAAPLRRDRTSASPDDDPNIWRETNNAALMDLDSWCGELGLPKLKRLGNGSWEAVPVWRPSNTGTDMMRRKSNLKIHRDGIKDMGVDIGHTALDVVCAAFSWDFDTAFSWLRRKLRLEEDIGDLPERPRMLNQDETGAIYDATTGVIVAGANDDAPADSKAELPERLTRVPGLLGDMVDWIEATARRPNRVLSLGAATAVLGTLIGRRDATPTKSGTHLYVLALAPSGAGKQHGIDAGKALMEAAGAGRHEGASEALSQSAMVADLMHEPLSLSFVDEFGDVLAKLNAPNAGNWLTGVKSMLKTAWGSSFSSAAAACLTVSSRASCRGARARKRSIGRCPRRASVSKMRATLPRPTSPAPPRWRCALPPSAPLASVSPIPW